MNDGDDDECDITILPQLFFANKPKDLCRISHLKAIIIYKQGIAKILEYLCDPKLPLRTHQFLLSCVLPTIHVHENYDFISQIVSTLTSEQLNHIQNTQLIYQLSDIIASLLIIHFKNTGIFLFEVNSVPSPFDVSVYKSILKLLSETESLIPTQIPKEEQKERKKLIKLLHAELTHASINSLVQSTEDSLDFFNSCLLFNKKDDINSIVLDPEILGSIESSNAVQNIFAIIQENQIVKSILGIKSLTHLTRATNCMQIGSVNIIVMLMDAFIEILPHCKEMDPNLISVMANWILSLKLNSSVFDASAVYNNLVEATNEIIYENFINCFEIVKATIKQSSQISEINPSVSNCTEQIFLIFIDSFLNSAEAKAKEIFEIVKSGSLDNTMALLWTAATPDIVNHITECISENPGFAVFFLASSLLDNRSLIPSPEAALPIIDGMYDVVNYCSESYTPTSEAYIENSIINYCIRFMNVFPQKKLYKVCGSQNDYVEYIFAITRFTLICIQNGVCLDEANRCLDILFEFEKIMPFQPAFVDDFIQNIPNMPQDSYVYKTACRVLLINGSVGTALINNLAQSDSSVSEPRLKLTAALFQNTFDIDDYMELLITLYNNKESYFDSINFQEDQKVLIKFMRDVADSAPKEMKVSKYSIKNFELFLRLLKKCIIEKTPIDSIKTIIKATISLLQSTLGNVGIMNMYVEIFRFQFENRPKKDKPPKPDEILRLSNPFEELFTSLINQLKEYQPKVLVQFKEMGNVLSKFLLESYKASPNLILENDDNFYFVVNFTRAIFLVGGKQATEYSSQLVKLLLKERLSAFGHHIILAMNALSSNQDIYGLGLLISSYVEYDIALVQFALASFELQFGLCQFLKRRNRRGPSRIPVSSIREANGIGVEPEEDAGLRREAEAMRKKMRALNRAVFGDLELKAEDEKNKIIEQFSIVRNMVREFGVWLDSDVALWPVLTEWDFTFGSRETLMVLTEVKKGSKLVLLEDIEEGSGVTASRESPIVLIK